MKSHLAKVSLALLSTVFLLGCQDLGSEPVGPEDLGPEFTHKNGKPHGKPGGDPPAATLTLADGMLAADFDVEVSKDTRKTLKVSNHNHTKPTIDMDFGSVGCVGFVGTNGGTLPSPGEIIALKLELTEDATDAKVVMSIEKANLGSEGDHALIITYDDPVLGLTSIMLGGWPGPVHVAEGPTDDEFTFSGDVVVWDREGGNDDRLISCPNAAVVVTLTR